MSPTATRPRSAATPPASLKVRNARRGTEVSGPAGQGRVVKHDAKHKVGSLERVRGIFDQSVMWDAADELPPKVNGRHRKLPEVMYLAAIALADVWHSFRAMEAELRDPVIWEAFVKIVAASQAIFRPEDDPLDVKILLSTSPLTMQNVIDARRLWAGPAMAALPRLFEECAAVVARELGYGDPNGRGGLNEPIRERFIATDGKVTKALRGRYRALSANEENKAEKISTRTHVVDLRSGEIIATRDMRDGTKLYITGVGPAVGHKTIRTSLRNDMHNSTVVTTVRAQTTTSEADEAVNAIIAVNNRLAGGVLGAVMDKAGMGCHIKKMAAHGMLLVPPIRSDGVAGDGALKTVQLLPEVHYVPSGAECVHKYYAHGGAFAEAFVDDRGNVTLTDLPSPRVRSQPNKNGFRTYVEWRLTCRVGLEDHEPEVDLDVRRYSITGDDTKVGGKTFNVAENLRVVSPRSERYHAIYGWRQNEESGNMARDSNKYLRRARSRNATWSLENEIGAAIVQNGIALRLHRQRASLTTQAA